MRKNVSLIVAALAVAALCYISCEHEGEKDGSKVIRNAVKDVDGNKYDAVRIRNQVWMRSNLRTKHFRDGSSIPQANQDECSFSDPYFYQPTSQELPEYDEKTFGLYYNWSAVSDARGLCPEGWHVPSDMEWSKLEDYVSSRPDVYGGYAGYIAKALASKVGWMDDSREETPGNNPKTNNSTGFSAFPAGDYSGYYDFDDDPQQYYNGYYFYGDYYYKYNGNFGRAAIFWSSTERNDYMAWERGLFRDYDKVDRDGNFKDNGSSVRCVRD